MHMQNNQTQSPIIEMNHIRKKRGKAATMEEATRKIPLSDTSTNHFHARRNIHGFAIFESSGLTRSRKKWHDSFQHVMTLCPQLKRTIQIEKDANGESAYLVLNVHKDRKPTLTVIDCRGSFPSTTLEAGKEFVGLKKRAREVLRDVCKTAEASKVSQYETTPSFQMAVLLGHKTTAIIGLTPHYLLDGTGFSTCAGLVLTYARLPRALWFAVNRMVPRYDPPSHLEMALKDSYGAMLHNLGDLPSSNLQCYLPKYYAFVPNEEPSTTPSAFSREWQVPSCVFGALKTRLRKEYSLALSAFFTAVVAKIAASILERFDPEFSNNDGDFYVTIPFDMRALGKWNKTSRDKHCIPILGDYSRALLTPVSVSELLAKPFVHSANVIATDIHRLKNDEHYRAAKVLQGQANTPKPNLMCGVSSVRLPSSAFKMAKNLETEASTDLGGLNRVWMTIVSREGSPSISFRLDVALSLKGLTETKTQQVIRDVVDGTLVEDCCKAVFNVS